MMVPAVVWVSELAVHSMLIEVSVEESMVGVAGVPGWSATAIVIPLD